MEGNNQVKNIKRNMFLLFSGRFISDFGTALFRFSLSLYVLDVTGSSALYSLMLTLTILPGILMSIFAGAIIDKYDKKKIIGMADLLSAISTAVLLVIIENVSENVLFFGIGVVLVSFIQTFLNLGINSGVGNMAPPQMISKVNSYFQAMGAILTIIGPIIGAVCYGAFGIKTVLVIDCISYGIGAVSILFMEFTKTESVKEEEFGIRESVKYIYGYVRKYKVVKMLMIMLFGLTFVYYPLTNVAIQNIMRLRVSATENQLSYTVAALGVGVVVGALFASMQKLETALKKISYKMCFLAIMVLLWCMPIIIYLNIGLSGNRNTIITCLFMVILFCMGVCYTQIVIPSYSYMQMYVDENLRGRVFGFATSALNIAAPVGLVIYGFLLDMNMDIIVITVSTVLLVMLCVYVVSQLKDQSIFTGEVLNEEEVAGMEMEGIR